jgi:enoyl-CoA hydratase/carnithine racemase
MSEIIVRDEGPVRVVLLNRPEKGHAITKPQAEELQRILAGFDACDQRVLVLGATGTRAFTFGADMTDPPELWRVVPGVGYSTLKPVIGAFEGWCVGSGLVIAAMCDLAVAGAGAKFSYPEAKVGLTGGMIASLAARIPHKIAMELMLACKVLDAQRALSAGLVNEVVPEGQALARAITWGQGLAGFAPLVMAELKRMVIDEVLPRGPSERMAIQAARIAAVRGSEDRHEGVAAFREKRPPKFKGR